MANIKISGFYDEVSGDLKTQLETIKAYGESYLCPRKINGKNIADYTLEEFEKDIKPMLDEYGVKFSSIGSPIGKIGLYDDKAYESQLRKLEELVKICQLMGCKYIRMFSFRGLSGKYDLDLPVVVKRIKGFLEKVKGTDVVLLHENEKRIWADTPERVLELYKAIDDPQFQLCFDASNYVQCGVDVPTAYEMLKDVTVYYHVKDCSPEKVEVPLGLGIGDYQNIINDLVKRGYDGFMTMEPHTGKYADNKKLFHRIGWLFFGIKFEHIDKWRKIFHRIDEAKGIGHTQPVSRRQMMDWQYEALKEMIANAQNASTETKKTQKKEA